MASKMSVLPQFSSQLPPNGGFLFAPQSEGELTTYSIVLGNINGQLKQAFAKLTSLHTKNNFSLAIVTGNLFADDDDAVVDLLTGKITIPLPTYFTVATNPLPQQIIDKIEKDEEVRRGVGHLLLKFTLLIINVDMPKPSLSRKTKHNKDIRGH
jgi:hypothetical protein